MLVVPFFRVGRGLKVTPSWIGGHWLQLVREELLRFVFGGGCGSGGGHGDGFFGGDGAKPLFVLTSSSGEVTREVASMGASLQTFGA